MIGLLVRFSMVVSAQPDPARIDGGLYYLPQAEALVTLGGWGPPTWEASTEVWAISGTGWSSLPSAPEGMAHTTAALDSKTEIFLSWPDLDRLLPHGLLMEVFGKRSRKRPRWMSSADSIPN